MRVRTGAIIIREKKTSFIRIRLAPFWVRRWLLHIYFDSMKLHHKILQWLSIFLFYLDSQLFLHTSYFANPSIIHLICVCVHQINNLLLHELNQKWFHNATTYILLLHCKCTNCEKSSKLECGMYILDFFFMKWQVEANHMRNLTADMIWMIFLKLQTYSKPNLWNVAIIEYIVFEDLKCLT